MSLVDVIGGERFEREAPIPCPYQTPRPSDEASQAYMNARWRSGDRYVADASRKMKQARLKARLGRTIAPRARSLLDFGAGSGAFVAAARRARFAAVGLERSASARGRARDFYDVDLIESLPHNARYDVTTLRDVIEHLREPDGLLRFLRQRMTAGGLLVVETGNHESWKRLARRDRWGLYLLDHHFFFTPTSRESMLSGAGFLHFALVDLGRAAPKDGAKNREIVAQAEAVRRWPAPGDINVMIATARA